MSYKCALFAMLLTACGGAAVPPPTAEPPKPAEEPAAPPPSATEEGDAESGKSLAEIREAFLQKCNAGVDAPDFCECGWGQMVEMFSLEEMRQDDPDPDKLARFKERLGPACAGKLPEESVKKTFVSACVGKKPVLQKFCACTWKELRKKVSVADFAVERTTKSPRFAAAQQKAIEKCGSVLPEKVFRDGFMKGCIKDPKFKTFCSCAWKVLRSRNTAAQIGSGNFDTEAAKPRVNKACKQHLPASR